MSAETSDLFPGTQHLPSHEDLSHAPRSLGRANGVHVGQKNIPTWKAAWLTELDRRVEEMENDPSSLQSWAEVKQALLDEFAAH